jgi:hypothetical protein
MTRHVERSAQAQIGHNARIDGSSPAQKKYRTGLYMFFAGVCLLGTVFLGPFGLILIVWGFLRSRKAEREGAIATHPWGIALLGAFTIADSAANFIGWSIDLFAGRAIIPRSAEFYYGTLFDGGYAHKWGTAQLGDVVLGGLNSPGEKALIVAAVLVVWPCRMAAAWAMLRMKPWGVSWMITSVWMTVTFWVVWVSNAVMDSENRFDTTWGVVGWFTFNGVYIMGPVMMLPYLYLIDQRQWLAKYAKYNSRS